MLDSRVERSLIQWNTSTHRFKRNNGNILESSGIILISSGTILNSSESIQNSSEKSVIQVTIPDSGGPSLNNSRTILDSRLYILDLR